MKKMISLILTVLMTAAVSSCGRNEESSKIVPYQDGGDVGGGGVLNIAITCSENKFDEIVSRFESEVPGYTVNVTDYWSDPESGEIPALSKLSMDILAGKVPDVVIALPAETDSLRKQGYLADLSPLMEEYDGLKRDDLLPNVLEGTEKDGEINALFGHFLIYSAYTKLSRTGQGYENWTYDDAMKAIEDIPEGSRFLLSCHTKYDLPHYMLQMAGRDCIDMNSGKCSFEKVIPEIFDFLDALPEEDYDQNWEGSLADDRALVNDVCIVSMGITAVSDHFNELDEEMPVFVGYPSSGGSGADIQIDAMYSIMDTSTEKEAAWRFINGFFTPSVQEFYGLRAYSPVTVSALEHLASDDMKYNANSIRSSITVSDQAMYLPEDIVQKYKEYISSVRIDPWYDKSLDDIIWTECRSVVDGEQSPEECAEVLNERIELYLAEQA